jgi:hypothetical protein
MDNWIETLDEVLVMKCISDELDEIYQQNGYNLSQIVGEDMSVVSFDLRDFLKAKQAILNLIEQTRKDELWWFMDRIVTEDTLEDIKSSVAERLAEIGEISQLKKGKE